MAGNRNKSKAKRQTRDGESAAEQGQGQEQTRTRTDGGRQQSTAVDTTRVEGRSQTDTFCRLVRTAMQRGVGEVVQGVLGINSRAVLVEVRVLAARRYHVAVRSRGEMLHADVVTSDGVGTAEAIAEVVGVGVTRMLTFSFDYSRRQSVDTAELFDVEE